jgi:hypothetical protein
MGSKVAANTAVETPRIELRELEKTLRRWSGRTLFIFR